MNSATHGDKNLPRLTPSRRQDCRRWFQWNSCVARSCRSHRWCVSINEAASWTSLAPSLWEVTHRCAMGRRKATSKHCKFCFQFDVFKSTIESDLYIQTPSGATCRMHFGQPEKSSLCVFAAFFAALLSLGGTLKRKAMFQCDLMNGNIELHNIIIVSLNHNASKYPTSYSKAPHPARVYPTKAHNCDSNPCLRLGLSCQMMGIWPLQPSNAKPKKNKLKALLAACAQSMQHDLRFAQAGHAFSWVSSQASQQSTFQHRCLTWWTLALSLHGASSSDRTAILLFFWSRRLPIIIIIMAV